MLFQQRHSLQNRELRIDLVLTDSFQDLIGEAIDVALRFGKLPDSNLVARTLIESPRMIAASPAYLEQAGIPKTPADLVNHKIILGPSSASSVGWTFQKDGKKTSVRVDSKLMVTVNEGATAAALAGLGIISASLVGCRSDIESGALVQLLPEWEIGTVEVHAVLSGGRNAKASSRAFVDYLVKSIRQDS